MTWPQIEKDVKEHWDQKILSWSCPNENRVYVTIESKDWPALCRYLYENLQARFIIASGVDTPGSGIEILYHFDFLQLPQVLSVRVFLKKPDPEIESVSGIFKAAEWIEREIQELLGVRFTNHPNPAHLLLPEDWPKGNFPLRRDQ
jgi:NADH-quinone oxidoreductase subunit C